MAKSPEITSSKEAEITSKSLLGRMMGTLPRPLTEKGVNTTDFANLLATIKILHSLSHGAYSVSTYQSKRCN